MRDRRIRLAFLGLILSFPWLLSLRPVAGDLAANKPTRPAAAPAPRGFTFEPTPAACWVELMLVVGLAFAGQQRRQLLALRGLGESAPAPVPSRPHRLPVAWPITGTR
jgi:hypothetical protein